VLNAIETMDSSVKFTWNFSEISPVIATLAQTQQQQAACLIAYFEAGNNQQNRERLRVCISK